jgi:glycerophosphoryl diester phosphodiesterase
MKRPTIIAHRGASARAPENKLAAFRMAMEVDAEGVEFDVRLAKDGVPVIIHDRDLKRTAKRPEKVSELTSKELAQVDVGSWFNRRFPRRARPAFQSESVPTLQQTLAQLINFRGPIYVELKANASTFRDLSAAVCNVIRNSPQLPQNIVKRFKLASKPEVKHFLPSVQTAGLFGVDVMLIIRHREHIVTLASEFGADQISLHHSLISPKLVHRATEAGMPITVWTVDDPRWLSRRRNLNIDALITNDPSKFLS